MSVRELPWIESWFRFLEQQALFPARPLLSGQLKLAPVDCCGLVVLFFAEDCGVRMKIAKRATPRHAA